MDDICPCQRIFLDPGLRLAGTSGGDMFWDFARSSPSLRGINYRCSGEGNLHANTIAPRCDSILCDTFPHCCIIPITAVPVLGEIVSIIRLWLWLLWGVRPYTRPLKQLVLMRFLAQMCQARAFNLYLVDRRSVKRWSDQPPSIPRIRHLSHPQHPFPFALLSQTQGKKLNRLKINQ